MFSGYAFAAIKKTSENDYDSNAGPSGNGIRYDDPEDDTKPGVTYTITGQGPVLPYTPFTVTVTASDHKTAGTHGSLSGKFSDESPLSYEVRSQSGWSSGANTYTLGVKSCERQKSAVTFSWLTSGKTTPRHTIAYNAGHMVPNIINSAVNRDTTFSFTVKFSSTTASSVVPNCYGSWKNFGASIKFEIWDGVKWTSSPLVYLQSIGGSNGSFSGTGFCGLIDTSVDKIRICVTYAGETLYDEASVANSHAVIFQQCPSTLHIFGEASPLVLYAEDATSSHLPVISAETNLGTPIDIDDYFEDEDGNSLDFTTGWTAADGGGMTWTGTIQAKAGAAAPSYPRLVAHIGGSESHQDIYVIDTLHGTITAPEKVVQNVTCYLDLIIAGGTNGAIRIPRLPASVSEWMSLEGDGLTVSDYDDLEYNEESGNWESIATCVFSQTGEIDVGFLVGANLIGTAEILVIAIKSALVEAINERFTAKGGTIYPAEDTDTAAQLRTKAISACAGYVNFSGVAADGSCTVYTDSGSGVIDIDTAAETPEWYQSAYEKVRETIKNVCVNWSVQLRFKTASGQYTCDSDNNSEAEAKSNALSQYNNSKSTGEWGTSGSLEAYYFGDSGTTMYGYWTASLMGQIFDYRIKPSGTSSFSRTSDFYFKAKTSSESGTYSNLGHHSLASGASGKFGSSSCSANSEFDWWTWDTGNLTYSWDEKHGYGLDLFKIIITYGFTHK